MKTPERLIAALRQYTRSGTTELVTTFDYNITVEAFIEMESRLAKRVHELKIDSHQFVAILAKLKNYEIRKNDRDFRVGDRVLLRETVHSSSEMLEGSPLEYTGFMFLCEITDIRTGYGIKDGFCVFGFVAI